MVFRNTKCRRKGTQIVFDKMPGLEMQCTQIAHFKQRLGQIQLQEITGGIGMGEVGLKHGVMGRGGRLFMFIRPVD